ncbi:hypothetical protein WR25_15269 [Diploscapter pachys]|uniref:ShKT domain-containing protein n=1 Tax=Diploscapter pachys TaxID=2018661 RepID=A0A2A2M1N4_9BILA|nr:hypothetical protein WR25_15269 [Diploscapter pachys]
MGNDGDIGALEYRLQFSRGSFRISLDSALQFVVVDGGWLFTALIFLEARISCREAIEPAVDCSTRSSALTECVVDVSGRSACVVVLAPLVVDDCSKLGFTYNGRRCDVSTTTIASSTCVDKLNPKTGVSDCPRMASYCNNTIYYDLITDQCPKTCGRCDVSTTTTASSTCVDKLNPKTGVSDCPRMASYCNNTVYYE